MKHESQITAREELVDFNERRKYSELAARLRGLATESRAAGPNIAVQVNIGSQARPQTQEERERAIAVKIPELTGGFDQSTIAETGCGRDSCAPGHARALPRRGI